MIRKLLIASLFCTGLYAQATFDFSGAGKTIPFKMPQSTPGTCSPGELYWDTNSIIWQCKTLNTWTILGFGPAGVTSLAGVNTFTFPVGPSQGNNNVINIGGPPAGLPATLFINKQAQQYGVYVYDNTGSTLPLLHSFNTEIYGITGALANARLGYRAHIDPNNTTASTHQLAGFGSGCHANNSDCYQFYADGANSFGIYGTAIGANGYYQIDGTALNHNEPTVGISLVHYGFSHMIFLQQTAGAMTGHFIYGNSQVGGLGTFSGNYIEFDANSVPKFIVDFSGKTSTSALLVTGASTQAGTTLTAAAPTVAASQVGMGSTVAANTSCGTLAGSAGCLVINVAGTTRYLPYY